jgi:hypothetical protein
MIICVSAVKPGAGLYPKHLNLWRSPPGEAGGQLGVALGERRPVRRRPLPVAAGRRLAAGALGPAGQATRSDGEANEDTLRPHAAQAGNRQADLPAAQVRAEVPVSRVSLVSLLAVIGAAFNGVSFVNYGHAFSSMIMAVLWALALGCYVAGAIRAAIGMKTPDLLTVCTRLRCPIASGGFCRLQGFGAFETGRH